MYVKYKLCYMCNSQMVCHIHMTHIKFATLSTSFYMEQICYIYNSVVYVISRDIQYSSGGNFVCGVREVRALCDVKKGECITYFVFCYRCINDIVKNRDSKCSGG